MTIIEQITELKAILSALGLPEEFANEQLLKLFAEAHGYKELILNENEEWVDNEESMLFYAKQGIADYIKKTISKSVKKHAVETAQNQISELLSLS